MPLRCTSLGFLLPFSRSILFFMTRKILYSIITILVFISCNSMETIIYRELPKDVDSLEIHEGIVSLKAQRIKYKRNGKRVATIEMSEPVMVAQAEQEEKWGYFQFPFFGKAEDGTLKVTWQMAIDTYQSYGSKSKRAMTPMISKDGGNTWVPQDKDYLEIRRDYGVIRLKDKLLQVITPKAKDIHGYDYFPKPVMTTGNRSYFLMDSIPADLQGIYISYMERNKKPYQIHAKLTDPKLLRYSINDEMPIVWWGNIRQLSDHSLVAGIHPCYYLDSLGHVTRSSVTFYRSEDEGHSWEAISKIPFVYDGVADVLGDKMYDEPAFEVLADSTFICVMRTGSTSPLYKTFSYDKGKSWTRPRPFTPNGVMPKLMLLENGILVLISGRPGVQVRFSFDGTGRTWSDPIDMIPFMKEDGSYIRDVSCGYASFVDAGYDSFYLVYSDFTKKDASGNVRKSIWCRKIKVEAKSQ